MKSHLIFLFFLKVSFGFGQGNCLIYDENSGERKACEYSYKAIEFPQGSRISQMYFDSAIAVGPKYAWAYYEKSVPYFKRGLPHQGLNILNKAVELEPIEYLHYRASWYFECQNYDLCVQDLEHYYKLPEAYQQFTPGGEMDMRLILGLAYAKLGKLQNAIAVFSGYFDSEKSEVEILPYDYHSFGIIYYLNQEYENAIINFEKQIELNPEFADTYYYLGLAEERVGSREKAQFYFKQALALITGENGGYSKNDYCYPVSKSDVEMKLRE